MGIRYVYWLYGIISFFIQLSIRWGNRFIASPMWIYLYMFLYDFFLMCCVHIPSYCIYWESTLPLNFIPVIIHHCSYQNEIKYKVLWSCATLFITKWIFLTYIHLCTYCYFNSEPLFLVLSNCKLNGLVISNIHTHIHI